MAVAGSKGKEQGHARVTRSKGGGIGVKGLAKWGTPKGFGFGRLETVQTKNSKLYEL